MRSILPGSGIAGSVGMWRGCKELAMRTGWVIAVALLIAQGAQARCQNDLPVGSRLLARKTISGWIE